MKNGNAIFSQMITTVTPRHLLCPPICSSSVLYEFALHVCIYMCTTYVYTCVYKRASYSVSVICFSSYAPTSHCFNFVALEHVLISDRNSSPTFFFKISVPGQSIFFFTWCLQSIYLVKRLLKLHYIYGLTFMKLSYSAHEKTMLFSSRVLYQMKVNKNQPLCVRDVIILIENFIQAHLFENVSLS